MKKRLITTILASAMILSLAACASEEAPSSQGTGGQTSTAGTTSTPEEESNLNPTGLPLVKETETISIFSTTNNTDVPEEDMVFWNEVEAATGVEIEWEIQPGTTWNEKKGLFLARSDLPDIVMGRTMFTDVEYLNMIDGDQLLPLNDLLDTYGENWKKLTEADPELLPSITASNGNIYAIPDYIAPAPDDAELAATITCLLNTNSLTYINKTWLDKLGLDMPTTWDELEDVLMAFKTQDPNGNNLDDEIPLSSVGVNYYDGLFGAFGILPNNTLENISYKDGEVVFTPVQEEYKDAIIAFNSLWEQGLLDPETFTQDSSMFNAKLKSPTRVVGMFQAWRGTSWRLDDNDTEYAVLPALTGPNGDSLYEQSLKGVRRRFGAGITTDAENPELAMRFLDYLLETENAYQMWTDSKVGYNLEFNEAEGRYDLIKPMDVTDPEQKKQLGVLGFTCVGVEAMLWKPLTDDPFNVDNEIKSAEPFYVDSFPEEQMPNVFLTLDEADVISEAGAEINSYVSQMYAQWITGGGIEDEWDDYINRLNGMGLEEYIANYQSAADRMS